MRIVHVVWAYIITESLCHKLRIYRLYCLTLKSNEKIPFFFLWEESVINYHITSVIIIPHETRWYGRAIKCNFLAMPASFSIIDKRFHSLFYFYYRFAKFTLGFIFMCYLHLIIICYTFELLPSLLYVNILYFLVPNLFYLLFIFGKLLTVRDRRMILRLELLLY